MNDVTLIGQFFDFLENNNGQIEDLYLSKTKKQKLESLIGAEKAKNFEVIVAHTSHSLVCFWVLNETTPKQKHPIVWLDSEGAPNSVFAQNFEEFLSLIPYGSGTIYDILSSWLDYMDEPDSTEPPLERFDKIYLEELLNEANENENGLKEFILWLNKVNVKIAENPVELIRKAIKKYPDLLQ
ncbi:hypothetical protein [Negadavirga shengliensis]|uniref:SMI1/KNR4 family protein n=1 Tax=Negadavirga shengliensis TaxID=1389218 RepID=A0ABV9T723_9BACT